ncbi:hypothetical protein CHELA1G11_50009 [Hyphomicrobiales bacterium]|nr:hypothetical protein CHELA1G11_50009 [Hyphomicrobiales bacterium]
MSRSFVAGSSKVQARNSDRTTVAIAPEGMKKNAAKNTALNHPTIPPPPLFFAQATTAP